MWSTGLSLCPPRVLSRPQVQTHSRFRWSHGRGCWRAGWGEVWWSAACLWRHMKTASGGWSPEPSGWLPLPLPFSSTQRNSFNPAFVFLATFWLDTSLWLPVSDLFFCHCTRCSTFPILGEKKRNILDNHSLRLHVLHGAWQPYWVNLNIQIHSICHMCFLQVFSISYSSHWSIVPFCTSQASGSTVSKNLKEVDILIWSQINWF